MWDFLETIGGKVSIITASIIGIIGILQKFTSLKIWTWIKEKRRKAQEEKLKPIMTKLDTLTDLIEINRVKEIRFEILNFENSLIRNPNVFYNERYFANINDLINEYEQKYKDKHNGEIQETIEFIRKKEEEKKEKELKSNTEKKEEGK